MVLEDRLGYQAHIEFENVYKTNTTFGYHKQKLCRVKIFACGGSKIISSTQEHVDYGDVPRVMMVVWGQWSIRVTHLG